MTTITPAQLAERARAAALVRITEADAHGFLEEWREQGLVREAEPGRWQLTARARAALGLWAVGISVDDDQDGAA